MKLKPEQFSHLRGRRMINSLTCYDYQMACWMNQSEIDFLLVGDSLGEVIYGHPNTQQVTVELIEHHLIAVVKGAIDKHVMADMPIGSYSTPSQAVANAKRFINCGALSVKCENPSTPVIKALCQANIAVCAHVGLTPQTNTNYRQQGRDSDEAQAIIRDGLRLVKNGAFLLLIEATSASTAARLTASSSVPTIGIASGENQGSCDGRILVIYDLVGLTSAPPKFVSPRQEFGKRLVDATNSYCHQPPQDSKK